jgi:hypothetical protein
VNAPDLDRIEATLGVALPRRYRVTMLAYPFAPDHEAAQGRMPDDLEFVLEQNQIIRPGPRHAPSSGVRRDRH